MTWRDKLELGLKEDAPYRKDNLPPSRGRTSRRVQPWRRPSWIGARQRGSRGAA